MYDYNVYIFLAICITLDVITGTTQAAYNKTLSSEKMRLGVYHKISYAFVLALAATVEYGMLFLELGFNAPVFIPTVVYITLAEVISIVENISKINPSLVDTPIFKLIAENKKRRKEDDIDD